MPLRMVPAILAGTSQDAENPGAGVHTEVFRIRSVNVYGQGYFMTFKLALSPSSAS